MCVMCTARTGLAAFGAAVALLLLAQPSAAQLRHQTNQQGSCYEAQRGVHTVWLCPGANEAKASASSGNGGAAQRTPQAGFGLAAGIAFEGSIRGPGGVSNTVNGESNVKNVFLLDSTPDGGPYYSAGGGLGTAGVSNAGNGSSSSASGSGSGDGNDPSGVSGGGNATTSVSGSGSGGASAAAGGGGAGAGGNQ